MRKRCSIFEQSWNGKPWQPTSSQTAEITKSIGADDKDLPSNFFKSRAGLHNLFHPTIRDESTSNEKCTPGAELGDELSFWPIWRKPTLNCYKLEANKTEKGPNHHHVKENRVKKGAEYWKREIDWSLAKKNCIEDETNSGTTTPSLSSSWCLPIWSPSPPCEYLTGV